MVTYPEGSLNAELVKRYREIPPVGHVHTCSESGTCQMEKCSP